jgi:RNA polymerase sigma-54 factor
MRLSELEPWQENIAMHILGNLDSHGYLREELSQIASECSVPLVEAKAVLSIIQSMDPIGVGAKDLSECLLIQLDHIGLSEDLPAKIIERYLQELARSDLKKIAQEESVTIDQVKQAISLIKKLDPYPARSFADENVDYVIPDVFIIKKDNEYVVTMNEQGFPRVQLNKHYVDMLAKDLVPSEEKTYVNQKYQSANWLIRSIEQRQRTILEVTKSIVKFQKRYCPGY